MKEDTESQVKLGIIELMRGSSVARNVTDYAMKNIWDDSFKQTRYTAYFMIGAPATFNLAMIMLRRRIHKKARLILTATSFFLCGIVNMDAFRRDMIKFSLKDPVMFQKMSLVHDMRNLVIKSEFERMQKLIEDMEVDNQSNQSNHN